ncbi:MAG: hypothetical protein MZW92_29650 [Comamonadaceae bacterium]|nr:hypothetical protein [Comamonadaceae bacterium]
MSAASIMAPLVSSTNGSQGLDATDQIQRFAEQVGEQRLPDSLGVIHQGLPTATRPAAVVAQLQRGEACVQPRHDAGGEAPHGELARERSSARHLSVVRAISAL